VVREKTVKLTKFELDVMHALWELGAASVREIQEQLPEKKRPAYTTVQTIVRRLEEKAAVRRVKKIGNAFIFEPVISRNATHNRLISELLELFGGSARPLMAHLAEAGKLSLEDLREMESLLAGPNSGGEETDSRVKEHGGSADTTGIRR
jgi:predicted transcriptional regulator